MVITTALFEAQLVIFLIFVLIGLLSKALGNEEVAKTFGHGALFTFIAFAIIDVLGALSVF